MQIRSKRVLGAATALAVGAFAASRLLARHPTNPGPANPPIRFPLPPPRVLTPQEELKTFRIQPGFRIELVASEPMVEDPVAISFDARGRMWVVEMRGYMHDMEGAGETEPTGRIKVLESTHADGHYDKATIFLDGLVMPRSVLPVRGGALVGEPPYIWFAKDATGSGKADRKIAVAADFGARGGQPEYMANALAPNIDNWIYATNYSKRLRFAGGKWVTDITEAHGQWGLTQDDCGRQFFNYNEDLLRGNLAPAFYFPRNPNHPGTSATNVKVMLDETVWPSHPTPGVNRGYQEGILRDDGTLRACTANCGPCVYRGGLFGPSVNGNVFICEPAGNLVKRVMLGESRGIVRAQNVYYGEEFLTSTDERFRPVNLTVGPEGALYLVDFHRGVLEHERFITNYLAKNIVQRHLEQPIHFGRIFRILPEGAQPRPFNMPEDTDKLVEYLAHPNGWVCDMAQRLLVEKHDFNIEPALQKMAADHPDPLARLHALWTIEGMNRMEMPTALAALADADPHVRAAGVRLCELFLIPATRAQVLPALLKLTGDQSPPVRLQLLLTLSSVDDEQAMDAVASMLESEDVIDPALARDCALSGLWGRELAFLQRALARRNWGAESPARAAMIAALSRCVLAERHAGPVKQLLELAAAQSEETSWRRAAILRAVELRLPAPARRLPKLIWLDSEPRALAPLLNSDNREVRKLASALDDHLAWPGKPGVPPAPKVAPLTSQQQALFDRGRQVFTTVCAACHQPSGLGQEGLAPPLVDSEWLLGPEQRTIRIVLSGLSGPVTVDGFEYHLEMPAVGTLPDEDIAAVLTYARRSWEHAASPVAPETVRQVRQQTKNRAAPWTMQELMKIQ